MHKGGEERSDDIIVLDMLSLISESKWRILSVVLISLLVCALYLYTSPKVLIATVRIEPLSIVQDIKNKEFDNIFFSLGLEENACKKDIPFSLTREQLQESYIGFLKNKSLSKNIFNSTGHLGQENQIDENDAKQVLNSASFSSRKNNKFGLRDWFIRIEHDNESEILQILRYIDYSASIQAEEDLNRRFDVLLMCLSSEINKLSTQIDLEKQKLLSMGKLITQLEISYLVEQLEIARAVGVSHKDKLSGFSSNLSYLSGTEVLEKKLDMIRSRVNEEYLARDLGFLFGLEQNRMRVLRLKEAKNKLENLYYQSFNREDDNFKFANMRVDEVKFRDKVNSILLMLYSAILGLVVGSMYVLFSDRRKYVRVS